MTKRILSLVLALMLAVSVLAMPSLAATKDPDAEINTAYRTCPSCGTSIASYTTGVTETYTRTCNKSQTHMQTPHTHRRTKTIRVFDCPKNGCTYYATEFVGYSNDQCLG